MKNTFIHLSVLGFLLLTNPLFVQAQYKVQDTTTKECTIMYTNDFHSAFRPIQAYWLPGKPYLGGAAYLSTLIKQVRNSTSAPDFLFDTGDMFTGMISTLTKGEALMEMMMSMQYDAMAIGNHEFDYGADNFTVQMNRVNFPVLGANIFYKDSQRPYSKPYAIIEKDGLRLGVIGIIGQDARRVAAQDGIKHLDFRDPIPVVKEAVAYLRPQVDLIVVLAHQGHTGPMQTDAENRPEVQRDFEADIRLCGAVEGIDVFVGGHAHIGIETPYVHPTTGTLIVQTYGYGTRLGYLKLKVKNKKIIEHDGKLLKVWTHQLRPDPVVNTKIDYYEKLVSPIIGEELAETPERIWRNYNGESLLGAMVTDIMRKKLQTELAFQNAGGCRADLPSGKINKGHVLDAFPFTNTVVSLEMTGKQIKEVLEHSFSLQHGMMQVSGIQASYDLSRPIGQRLVDGKIGGQPIENDKLYTVAANSFVAKGGDSYTTFENIVHKDSGILLSTMVMDYLRKEEKIDRPILKRLVPMEK